MKRWDGDRDGGRSEGGGEQKKSSEPTRRCRGSRQWGSTDRESSAENPTTGRWMGRGENGRVVDGMDEWGGGRGKENVLVQGLRTKRCRRPFSPFLENLERMMSDEPNKLADDSSESESHSTRRKNGRSRRGEEEKEEERGEEQEQE